MEYKIINLRLPLETAEKLTETLAKERKATGYKISRSALLIRLINEEHERKRQP